MKTEQIDESMLGQIAIAGCFLGALFYYSPKDEETSSIIAAIKEEGWIAQWPCGDISVFAQRALSMSEMVRNDTSNESLSEAYQRLFIGPNKLIAPPWGSVYLDKESVLFGDSMLELREWLRQIEVNFPTKNKEPEDHIGLLLMLAAWLAEEQSKDLLVLLSDHLFPWSDRYLSLLEEQADNEFYSGLAQLTKITLDDWKETLNIKTKSKRLYF